MNDLSLQGLDALFWAKDRGCGLAEAKSAIVFGAKPHKILRDLPNPLCVQGFFGDFEALGRSGFNAQPIAPESGEFDLAIVVAGKHKDANFYAVSLALDRLREGGLIAIAAANAIGGKTFARLVLSALGGGESLNKNRSAVAWTRKISAAIDSETLAKWRENGAIERFGDYYAKAGAFSCGAIDAGSALLIKTIARERFSGAIADFGAGWGYLGGSLLRTQSEIKKMVMIEADYDSLELAKLAIADDRAEFVWGDATAQSKPKYDAIVMNPPFHSGYTTDIALGKSFIRAAHSALKPAKPLYLVANRRLPYEATLLELFSRVQTLAEKDGYKVLEAWK